MPTDKKIVKAIKEKEGIKRLKECDYTAQFIATSDAEYKYFYSYDDLKDYAKNILRDMCSDNNELEYIEDFDEWADEYIEQCGIESLVTDYYLSSVDVDGEEIPYIRVN